MGSIEVGKLADLVLWDPAFFGTKPDKVLKGGYIVWSQMGDANASIPTPQPVMGRPMFGAQASAIQNSGSCAVFVSQHAYNKNLGNVYGLRKRVYPVTGCRGVRKDLMKLNTYMPDITVDPETYEVRLDGVLCRSDPAKTVCMASGYYIF